MCDVVKFCLNIVCRYLKQIAANIYIYKRASVIIQKVRQKNISPHTESAHTCATNEKSFCSVITWAASYSPPQRNPVTGDGVVLPPRRRRHPAASLRGARPDLEPAPTHAYKSRHWPPNPGDYYVESTTRPQLRYEHTPYSLIGLYPTNEKHHESPNSNKIVLDKHWPPLPGQYIPEQSNQKIEEHPLPPHAFIGMTSALGDRPELDYKYDPTPTFDGVVDPYLVSNLQPPATLMKYEYDGPIPDVSLFETPVTKGPHTLTGFPPIFSKYVPGYLFKIGRRAEDFDPKTYYVDYVRRRDMWVGVCFLLWRNVEMRCHCSPVCEFVTLCTEQSPYKIDSL